jgi:succinate dehydrogenase / fumarate reductase cytochrome b subunit
MKTERPVDIVLTTFYWPLAAIASITHRITGVALFVAIAFMLYILDLALSSPEGFASAQALMGEPLAKLVAWGILALLIYHTVAGVKHLFLDFDIGDTLEGAKRAAQVVIVTSVVLIVLAGVWIW